MQLQNAAVAARVKVCLEFSINHQHCRQQSPPPPPPPQPLPRRHTSTLMVETHTCRNHPLAFSLSHRDTVTACVSPMPVCRYLSSSLCRAVREEGGLLLLLYMVEYTHQLVFWFSSRSLCSSLFLSVPSFACLMRAEARLAC